MFSAKDGYYTGGAGGIVGHSSSLSAEKISYISNCLALNYKLITRNGHAQQTAGRILGYKSTSEFAVPPTLSGNHAYDNIIWENLSDGTSDPISSSDVTDKNGADWDWRNSDQIPAGIFDNTAIWKSGTLPIMPKLYTTDGRLMANQPDV